MICPKCGYYSENDEMVCPQCGELLRQPYRGNTEGVQAIRQGKRAREAAAGRTAKNEAVRRRRRSGASRAAVAPQPTPQPELPPEPQDEEESDPEPQTFERRYRPVYDEGGLRNEQAKAFEEIYNKRKHRGAGRVNWVRITIIAAALLIIATAGGYIFLKHTDPGQRIMARLGQEANSTALWAIGEEQMDQGNITGAIHSFEKAKAQDEADGVVDVDGLLLLGSAYEAAGQVDDAAALYEQIYTETPSRTEAYVNHIRILQASGKEGDLAKAGELMKLAYDKTGEISFATQRSDLLPAPPEVDLTAGYYESKKRIAITSYQGYDVYYTFQEDVELPSGGVPYTERVFLDEGIHNLRAVAVNGELVSDELRATYKIIMPSPQTPRATLAPNTYKSHQRVRLKPGLDNENDDDIVIYYTVDGSPPDADSPVYVGDPIDLPNGDFVVLKAVAVNKYNKVSNTLEIKYKIQAKPYPLKAYTTNDSLSGLALYQTTMVEFQQKYGEGTGMETITMDGFDTELRKYEYPWGYAVMNRTRTEWVLTELYFTDTSTFSAPRSTAVGDEETYVVSRFRDMGQLANQNSGNRGLYFNDDGTGKIWADIDGKRVIRYRAALGDEQYWQLDYIINKNGNVSAIDWLYCP